MAIWIIIGFLNAAWTLFYRYINGEALQNEDVVMRTVETAAIALFCVVLGPIGVVISLLDFFKDRI